MEKTNIFPVLNTGQEIRGCWEGHTFTVLKRLGCGGNGIVYMVKDQHQQIRAMKVSADLMNLTSEYRMLVFLKQCPGLNSLNTVPKAYEIDDFRVGKKIFHFLILNYCPGDNINKAINRMTTYDAVLICRQVAEFFVYLHKAGFVYGDLKPGNLIYDFEEKQVHIIDYGSISLIGNHIKQYTPGYDRQSWWAGSRKADEKYDLFSLGLLLSTFLYKRAEPAREKSLDTFIAKLSKAVINPSLKKIIISTLRQETGESMTVYKELTKTLGSLQKDDSEKETRIFVNFVGITTVLSFLLSLAYFYL